MILSIIILLLCDVDDLEYQRNHTTLIAYDKHKMSDAQVNAEVKRLKGKCTELNCPCSVTTLAQLGVLELEWECDNHPSLDKLELDSNLEIGAEDDIMESFQFMPPTDTRFGDQ